MARGKTRPSSNQIGATSPNADTRNADIVKKTKQKERHIHTTERTRALWGLGARGWGLGAGGLEQGWSSDRSGVLS